MPPKKRRRRSFGYIDQRDNGNYYASYIGPDARRHRAGRGFVTKGAAEGWLHEEQKLISLDVWTPPAQRQHARAAGRLTVADLLNAHLEHLAGEGLRASTLQSYRRTIENRITEVSGKAGQLARTRIGFVTKADTSRWWEEINRRFPDTRPTNRAAYVRLRSAFTWAIKTDRLPAGANPAEVDGAGRKTKTKPKDLPTVDELRAIIAQLPDRHRVIGILTLFHGLRIGEALALRRKDVTITDGAAVVHVRGNLQRIVIDGHAQMVRQETKTEAGRRDVPVFTEFVDELAAHRKKFAGPRPGDLFTPTSAGKPMMDTSFRSVFARARKAAKVRDSITPHHGRNFLITMLAERGATPAEIGAILGQEDIATIVGIYMKVRDARAVSLMSTLEED